MDKKNKSQTNTQPYILNLASLTLAHHKKFLIAYSGGLDSHVLLHNMVLLRTIHPDLQLRAVYVNHNLSPNAGKWEKHCCDICASLQVEYLVKEIHINLDNDQSLEAVARAMRYHVFAEILNIDECLLTAHTKNDQAETILLQLLRGAGPKGLAAMPEKIAFAKHFHMRPLLNLTREDVLQYAKQHQLQWIEDESNFNLSFDRNYLRQELLPIILKRWPGALKTLSRSAKHCADASKLLTLLADQDLIQVRGSKANTLSIAQLLSLSPERQRNVLRQWLLQLKFSVPSEIKIHQIQYEILLAREDADPIIQWEGAEIRRYQDDIFASSPVAYPDPNWEIEWEMQSLLSLPADLGFLQAQRQQGKGLIVDVDKIMVRFRRGGERCHPTGRSGSHPLKKLWQEWHVPTWERDRIPLIFLKDKLIAVVGYCICEGYAAEVAQEGIVITQSGGAAGCA